jgi:hypothetical protein
MNRARELVLHYNDVRKRLNRVRDTGRILYQVPIGPEFFGQLDISERAKDIIYKAAISRQLHPSALFSDIRVTKVIRAKQQAWYLLHYQCQMPVTEIGKLFNRDHTTIAYGICRHAERRGLPNWRVHRKHPNLKTREDNDRKTNKRARSGLDYVGVSIRAGTEKERVARSGFRAEACEDEGGTISYSHVAIS